MFIDYFKYLAMNLVFITLFAKFKCFYFFEFIANFKYDYCKSSI